MKDLRDTRCVFLAVDGVKCLDDALRLIESVARGPMEPFLAGIKFNDALHAKWGGQALIDKIDFEWPGLIPFIDIKIPDVTSTDVNTLMHYRRREREFMATVSVHCSADAFLALRTKIPELKVAVMGVPTDMSIQDCVNTYGNFPSVVMEAWLTEREKQYTRLAEKVEKKPSGDHLAEYAISSFDMLEMFRRAFPWLKLVTPGIRDMWMLGNLAGQKRTTGCVDALEAGACYIVLGNQLFKGDPDNGISAEYSQILTADTLSSYFRQF